MNQAELYQLSDERYPDKEALEVVRAMVEEISGDDGSQAEIEARLLEIETRITALEEQAVETRELIDSHIADMEEKFLRVYEAIAVNSLAIGANTGRIQANESAIETLQET